MKDLVKTNEKGSNVTTSLMISSVFEKRHDSVLRDIKELSCSEEFILHNFVEISYKDSMSREQRAYEITKDGFSFLVMGYSGVKASQFKETFIKEFNIRESLIKDDDFIVGKAISILAMRNRALEERLDQKDRQIEAQIEVIQEAAPKVDYYDNYLTSHGLLTINQIAMSLGVSAVFLNKWLCKIEIQYKVNDTFVLFASFRDMGYAQAVPYKFFKHDKQQTRDHLYWTEKGKEFIISTYRQGVILPKYRKKA